MSTQIVAEVRAKYPTPITEEQSVKICNEVAARLGDPWGLRRKAGGTQWGGYALDVIVHRGTGELVDILFSTPTVAGPQWLVVGYDADLWSPIRLDWLEPTDPPPPPPAPPPDDRLAALESRVTVLESRVRAAGQVFSGV